MDKEKSELKKLKSGELKEKLELYRRDLLSLRLASAASHVKDYSQFKKLKRKVAQALTYFNSQK